MMSATMFPSLSVNFSLFTNLNTNTRQRLYFIPSFMLIWNELRRKYGKRLFLTKIKQTQAALCIYSYVIATCVSVSSVKHHVPFSLYSQGSRGKPDSNSQLLHLEDLQQARSSVSIQH